MQTLKRHILPLLVAACFVLTCTSCHDREEYDNSPLSTFDALARTVDEHYCFFAEKDIDWAQTTQQYRSRIPFDITQEELFALCASMLNEIEDGHVNLSSAFDISSYRKWWTDYPQDFSLRTLQQYYLDFEWQTTCGVVYKILPENIGYLRYPSFSYDVGDGNLDYILAYLATCDGLIIDIRDNGGGSLSNIDTFLSRFIHEPMTAIYMQHKTGPGHSDFSEPYPITYRPAEAGRVVWDKPIALLVNRSTFSAANTFTAVMKQLPAVTVVGSRTGGGGGMPFTYTLPNGWTLRMSASPMTDANGNSIESGVEPSQGCTVHAPDEQLAQGKDAILDFAINLLK